MGKKIIKLTESDLYRIVRRVINEQAEASEDNSYYTIPVRDGQLAFKVIDGRLWLLKFDKNGEPIPVQNLNGVLSDFKVDYKSGQIIGDEFKNNSALTNKHWIEFNKIPDALPRQTEYTYKFLALVPKGTPSKIPAGTPIIYTAEIVNTPSKNHYAGYRGYSESKNGEVGQYVYYKSGGEGHILTFSSGGYVMGYESGKPNEDPIPNEKPFELNVESPFKFDETNLTDDAKLEFKKFIESVKENYANVQGDVEVICSASIDGAPDQKRIDYDMNLSKKRAEAIVSILKTSLPGTKLNFIPKGIGQTDQFAKGKKWPDVKDKNQTAPNRRLIIKLPQIMKQQQ
jgi:outer membrane protein OmpA-like peptidoglycan-associated protein